MNASPEESIKRIQREILTTKTEIGNVERFRETVEKAIAELTGRKYAPLDKALKEYGTFGEIHNAYGYDYISEKRFRNLKKLHDERQNDPTGRLTADVLEFIFSKIKGLELAW